MASPTTDKAPSSLNDQITDAVAQIGHMVWDTRHAFVTAAAYQTMSRTLSLAMQNAVDQQQHSHMLRSALTTAAAKALLAGKYDEANAVLKLAESPLVNPDFTQELGKLREAFRMFQDDLAGMGQGQDQPA